MLNKCVLRMSEPIVKEKEENARKIRVFTHKKRGPLRGKETIFYGWKKDKVTRSRQQCSTRKEGEEKQE